MKRIVSILLAIACLLGCLTGCKQEEELTVEAVPTYSTGAMGRYVEKSIPLPEGKYVLDMVLLRDGRLRVSMDRGDGTAFVSTTGQDRVSWESTWEVPEEILATGSVSQLALSPEGNLFCHTWRDKDENGNYGYHFWSIHSDGTYVELPITCPDVDLSRGYMVPSCDFTDDGKLYAQFQISQVRQVDLTTGELGENINEQHNVLMKVGCAGEAVYMAGWETVSVCEDGVTSAPDTAMGQQLNDSLKATEGNTPRFVYWQNPEGYLFYTTHEGLFSFIPGGSITEELVSGSRSSLGDPSFLPVALAGGEDDTFYVLGSRASGENALLYYAFDAEVPTVSDTRLKIYSLYESEDFPKMVSQYQVAHPEVEVELEIGMDRESGITVGDALRTLNTEILAGSGPDLICLDGFNLDAYREKGMLADLSDILAQAEPTLSQITKCYEEEGRIFAVPTSFCVSAVYGPEHIVSQMRDWDSLVAAVQQLKGERTDIRGVLGAWQPVDMAEMFYDCSAYSWRNGDGTISEEKLTEFYTAMKNVWALDSEIQEVWADRLYEELYHFPGEYVGMFGSTLLLPGEYAICFGVLNGMRDWAGILAADSELDSYTVASLTPDGSGVFIPKGVMGILSNSQHPQAAGEFLKFMLSEEVQAKDLTYSFPVNQAVFDKETTEDRVVETWVSGEDEKGNHIGYQFQWPDEEARQMFRSWVAGLHTPASTDHIIRSMVQDQMHACVLEEITPQEAAQKALQSINLYLAE